MQRQPVLKCSHKTCLIDEPIQITASGLEGFSAYTISVLLTDEGGFKFGGCAHFVADQTGCFSTTSSPSIGGSYLGKQPMGLFTHMLPLNGQRKGLRLLKRDVTKPYKNHLGLHAGHLDFTEMDHFERTPICSLVVERTYLAAGVRRTAVRRGRFRGNLFLPPGKGPFPTVIDLFGTIGGLIEHRSALLASHGIASLALAYFNYEDLPDLTRLELEYFLEAALRLYRTSSEWLANLPTTMSQRIGVVGVSYGAEIAVLMGIVSPYVVAVAPIGCPVGLFDYPITLNKKPLPCGQTYLDRSVRYIAGKGWCFFSEGISIAEDIPFHLEEAPSDTQFMFIYGQEDPFCKYEVIEPMLIRAQKFQVKNFEVLWYPGAGHLLEPPYSPLCDASWNKRLNDCFYWGGQPDWHAEAQSDAWIRVQRFFHRRLSGASSKL